MGHDSTKKTALVIATLSSFMTPFMGSSINIALPSIEKEFGIDAVLLSWVATSYLLSSAVALVPFGRLADIYGRKRTFAWGITLFTISSLLCALSFSASSLILFRVLQGIGGAMVYATGMAILTSVFPPRERGKVLGINVAAVYLGLSLGPSLGGLLTHHLTWRSVFLVNVPFGLVIIGLVVWRLKEEWAEARGEEFDLAGTFIYCLALIAIMVGISLLPAPKSAWFILLGVGGIWGFLTWEARTKSPVFELSLFKTNRTFAFSNLAALINYSATFAVTFLLSLYLQNVKGLNPQSAGLILVFQPMVMAFFSPFAGRLSDRIEPRIVASIGMILTTLGLFLFTFIHKDTSLTRIIGNLVILGLGFALFSSPNTNAIMGSVEKRFYGIASGAVGTMRLLGMMISMGVATLTFALWIGRVRITTASSPDFMTSLRVAFTIFALLCFCGIFASMVRGHLHSRPSGIPVSPEDE
jgi:EmrB/QacA subfamily drug resistance transporter